MSLSVKQTSSSPHQNLVMAHYNQVNITIVRSKLSHGPSGNVPTHEGRVEYCSNGLWGTISSSGFDTRDGEVVCRQLGHQNPRDCLKLSVSSYKQFCREDRVFFSTMTTIKSTCNSVHDISQQQVWYARNTLSCTGTDDEEYKQFIGEDSLP